MKVLSIDWDYFINASAEQRYSMFPDGGNENLPSYIRDIVWATHYNGELEKIGIKENDLEIVKDIIANRFDKIMIADSHKHIFDFVTANLENEELEVTNIDFHHDLYGILDKSRNVDCGNWMVKLFEDYDCKYNWIKQADSDTALDDLNFCEINIKNIEDIIDDDFDLLYICKSGIWSPPHLDKYFIDTFSPLIHQTDIEVEYEVGIFDDRYNETFLDIVKQNNEVVASIGNKMIDIEK